jgi:hypothetical protein
MLRKKAIRRPAGKQKNARGTNTRRAVVVAAADTLPIGREQAAETATVEQRLHSAAKEAFQNMGED